MASGSHIRVLCVLTVCLTVLLAGIPSASAGGLGTGGGVPAPGDQPPSLGGEEPGKDPWRSLMSSNWEPPVVNLTDPNPQIEILTVNESEEAYIPHYVPESYENTSKPDPNFVVENVNTGRTAAMTGTVVIVNATINNTGYRHVSQVNVSFYDGTPNNYSKFATVTANFDGFLARTSATWIAFGLGIHDLYVVADPDEEVRELSEDDNSNATAIEVVSYYVSMPPDIIPQTEETEPDGIPVLDVTMTLNITVTNIGEDTAGNATVEVVDTSVNEILESYTIVSLAGGGDDLHYVSWTPKVAGLVTLSVHVDVFDNATEGNESNNLGDLLIHVMSSPPWPYEDPCPGYYSYHENEYIFYYGNLIIEPGTICTFVHSYLTVQGNVQVYGTLNLLQESRLVLRSMFPNTPPFLDVYGGGYLDSSSSRITALYSSLFVVSEPIMLGFVFRAHANSNLFLSDSEVYGTTYDRRTGKSGVQIETSQAAITSTTISYGRQDGVSCSYATPASFTGNVVERNVNVGISTYPGCTLTVSGGSSRLNQVGIRAGSSMTVDGVMIHQNRYAGVMVQGSSPTITGSTIQDNALYGIRVDGVSSPAITNNVKISTKNGFGVAVYGIDAVLTMPLIEYNPSVTANRVGIYVEGTDARIRYNTVDDSVECLEGQGTVLLAEFNTLIAYPEGVPLQEEIRFGYVEVAKPSPPGSGEPPIPSTTEVLHNQIGCANGRPCTGIHMEDSVETRVEDNSLTEFRYGPFAMSVAFSSNVNISKNHFTTYTNAVLMKSTSGVLWKNALHQRDRFVPVSDPHGTGGCGIDVETSPPAGPSQLYILANWINFSGYSIYVNRSSPWIEWNQIVFEYYPPGHKFRDYDPGPGVEYHDIDRGAIAVYNGSSPMIRQNFIEGNSYGISLESGLEGGMLYPCNPIIEYNTIVLNGYQAIATGMRDALYDVNSPTIRHNMISRSSGGGIVTSSRGKVDIHDNTVENTHGITLLCNMLGGDYCPASEIRREYWAAVKIQVPYTPPVVPEQWIDVHNNNLRYGNQSGVWIAMGLDPTSPDNSVEIHDNPEIRDFIWGMVDEGPRPDVMGKRHAIYANTLWDNDESIQVKGNGMPLIQDNIVYGPRAEKPGAKGITFYGMLIDGTWRDAAHHYTYDQYNDIHEVNAGIFVYDTKYDGSDPTLTISANDHVKDSDYGIVSVTDDSGCSDAETKGSSFLIEDSKFTGAGEYGLYTRCASPQVLGSPSFSEFTGNKHGGFIYDHDRGRSGLFPRTDRGSFSGNDENGLHLSQTTVEIVESNFNGNMAGIVTIGTTTFSMFWNSIIQDNENVGVSLSPGASGIIGKDPDSLDPRNLGNTFMNNEQGIYAQQTSIKIHENSFEDNGLAVHLRANGGPTVYGNEITNTALDPCATGTLRDGVLAMYVNHPNLNLRIEANTLTYACHGVQIVSSGTGGSGGYAGWVVLSSNKISEGRGEGGLYVEASKVVSNLEKELANRDEIVEHRAQRAVYLYDAADFEAYKLFVTVYAGYPNYPNALAASGDAYFEDSTFEALTGSSSGGGLVTSHPGGVQTFVRATVNQRYASYGVHVNGGSVVFQESWIPGDGFPMADLGILVSNYGSASVENTRARGWTTAVALGWPGFTTAGSLEVKSNSDVQANPNYIGIRLYSYAGTVLIENSNIHGSQTGILHEDNNVDGTAMISGNTITGNNVGIKVVNGRPDIRDNTIQGNAIGISIMGGAPHVYGEEGAGNGNVITGNTQYGVYIAATADADCSDGVCVKVEWNDIYGNFGNGIETGDPGGGNYFYGKCNWWGDTNGPDDDSPELPDQNDNDPGQDVSDYFWYRDPTPPPPPQPQLWWLHESSQTATTCAP